MTAIVITSVEQNSTKVGDFEIEAHQTPKEISNKNMRAALNQSKAVTNYTTFRPGFLR